MSADKDRIKGWSAETGEEPGSQTQAWFQHKHTKQPEPPPEPAEPRAEQTIRWDEQGGPPQLTTAQRWLMLALVGVGSLVAVLPLALACWLCLGFLMLGAIGLMEPDAADRYAELEGARHLLSVGLAALLLIGPGIGLHKALGHVGSSWRHASTFAATGIFYFVLMGGFYAAEGELPPALFLSLCMASAIGALVCMPWALAKWIWSRGAQAWHWLERHAFWAGATAMSGGSAVSAVVIGWLLFADNVLERAQEQAHEHQIVGAVSAFDAADEDGIMSAWGLPSASSEPNAQFLACAEELAQPRPPHYRESWRDEGVRALQLRGTARSSEEDLAQTALIRVCLRHVRQPITQLGPYYIRSVQNLASKQWRRAGRIESCPTIVLESSLDDVYPEPDVTGLVDMMRALCKVTPDEKDVLLRVAAGETDSEIAAALGISRDAARKRIERARTSLRQHLTP